MPKSFITPTSSTSMSTTRQKPMSATHRISDQPHAVAINVVIMVGRDYRGIFECFFAGFCKRFVASDWSARMMRKRVLRGSITSSM